MRLIFHGHLRELYGSQIVMQASTVSDAIEGFSRQVGNWPSYRVDAVGFNTVNKLQSFAEEVHLVPAMIGGGGDFGSILIGAAMIGLAFATGGASLAATGLITTTLGAAMIVAGGLMILQGIVGLFMKAPKLDTIAVEDPEASKYFNVNKNTTAVGTPIIMAWGRVSLGGHWLSLQSDANNMAYGVFPTNPPG